MSNGIIVIGYQGIGKTTVAKQARAYQKVVDFESSLFKINGDRDENWYVIYSRQAVSLARQGYTVLVSSHKQVREELAKYNQDDFFIVSIIPSYKLKEDWIRKLSERQLNDPSDKNLAALLNAQTNFEDNIRDIASDSNFSNIFINDMNYDLSSILKGLNYMNSVRAYYEPSDD